MLLYLLAEAGADPETVEFAVLGPEPLRGAAPRPGRRRHGAGAGADADRRGRRQGAVQRHGHRRFDAAARRRLRVHGRRLPRRGARGAADADAPAGARARARARRRSAPRRSPRSASRCRRAAGRRRRRALRRDHRPLPRVALPGVGGDRRRGLRSASSTRSRIGGVLTRRRRPRHAARHRGRAGVTSPSPAARRRAAAAESPDGSPAAPVVRVRDLRMRYGDAEPVIDGRRRSTSAEGQVVSLIGPSGSGKSTVLAGDRRAARARRRHGRALRRPPRDGLPVPGRRAAAVAHGAAERGARAAAARRRRRPRRSAEADGWLARLGLAGLEDRYPRQLSGGQRKRVALAQVLALQPRLLLMDEPFASLDAIVRHHVTQDLLDWVERERIAVLLVTHDLEEAQALSDVVYLLSRGPAGDDPRPLPGRDPAAARPDRRARPPELRAAPRSASGTTSRPRSTPLGGGRERAPRKGAGRGRRWRSPVLIAALGAREPRRAHRPVLRAAAEHGRG